MLPPQQAQTTKSPSPPATTAVGAALAADHSDARAASQTPREGGRETMRFVSLSGRRAVCALAALVIAAGCSSTSKQGAAVGGASGAVIGAVIGNQGDRTGTGAVVGGAIGAAAGAIIGDYMAKQKKDLEQIPGAEVTQVGEELKVNFQSAILFDTDSYQLKASSRDELQQMAQVL